MPSKSSSNQSNPGTFAWDWTGLRALFGLLLLVQACSSVDRGVELPSIFAEPIGSIQLAADSTTGEAVLSLRSLKLDQSKAFRVEALGFVNGSFVPEKDSLFRYVPSSSQLWTVDSGTIRVSQGGNSKEGKLKVVRPQPRIQWVVTYETGTPLPAMPVQNLELGDSRNFENLNGLSESGAFIDSIWGFIYNASIATGGQRINYLSMGGVGGFLNFGTDHIYYRIKRPNGLYFRGLIPIRLGDVCLPAAANDQINLPAGNGFIALTSLSGNDTGCNSVAPGNPVVYRLEPLPYTGKKQINTRFGQIRDTTDAGQPAFYYKRFASGTQVDTAWIFLEEGANQRITRSMLQIFPN